LKRYPQGYIPLTHHKWIPPSNSHPIENYTDLSRCPVGDKRKFKTQEEAGQWLYTNTQLKGFETYLCSYCEHYHLIQKYRGASHK